MSARDRRIHDKRRAKARDRHAERDAVAIPSEHTRPVRFSYSLRCPSCGYSHADEMIAPSAAPIGAQVDITSSCTCGGQTHGTARVLTLRAT